MPTYTEAVYEISSTDEKPLGNLAHNKCYETNTGKFFRWNGEAWVEISLTDQGDINFTGNIQVGGYDGINERVTIGTKKLTFKEGICIGVEDV